MYEHENITNSASNSVDVGAGAELGKNAAFDMFQLYGPFVYAISAIKFLQKLFVKFKFQPEVTLQGFRFTMGVNF